MVFISDQAQGELTVPAQLFQAGVIQFRSGSVMRWKRYGDPREMIQVQGADHHLLDGVVGQHLPDRCQRGRRLPGSVSSPVIAAVTADQFEGDSQVAGGIDDAQGHGVHDAWLEQDRGQGRGLEMLVQRSQPADLRDRIDQQPAQQQVGLLAVERTFQKEAARRADDQLGSPAAVREQIVFLTNPGPLGIRCAGLDFNLPEHE